MNKPRKSTQIAIGMAILFASAIFGYRAYSNYRVSQFHFSEIEPGVVNIVGVDLGRGFKIVVANQMAQLRQVTAEDSMKEGSAGVGGNDREDSGDSSGKKSRVPMREMLGAMQGNEQALSRFVMILNNIKENDLPPERVYWAASDIQKALDGDPKLKQKLVNDLNIQLDGTPLPELRVKSLEDGIVIQVPVPIKVNVGGVQKTLTATLLKPFKPKLLSIVEYRYEQKANADKTMQIGYYLEESQKILSNPKSKEDIASELRGTYSQSVFTELAESPERVLRSAKIIVNDTMIKKASYNTYAASTGKLHDLSVELTSEGSDRLWQYSKNRIGTQLLLVANGVPIAAPRIRHELSQSSLDITQMPDEVLVREAVDAINKHKKGGPSH